MNFKSFTFLIYLFSLATSLASEDKSGFVLVNDKIPTAVFDIRYFGADNFLGTQVDTYNAPYCYLTKEATSALDKVQKEVLVFGLSLKIFDCYRPQKAVDHFVRWAKNLKDTKTKIKYFPNLSKSVLFDGYIAEKSGHTRGSTIDLTLVYLKTKKELDMGSGWDYLDTLSNTADPRPSLEQKKNRLLLKSLMEKYGFVNYKNEWWHFSLKNEPYPETYFNFPVQ